MALRQDEVNKTSDLEDIKMGKIAALAIVVIWMSVLLAFAAIYSLDEPKHHWQAALRREMVQLVDSNSPFWTKAEPNQVQNYNEAERRILASTVRIEVHGWVDVIGETGNRERIFGSSTSHATIVDGRYLVTHNHFDLPLGNAELVEDRALLAISLYTSDGKPITEMASPDSYSLTMAGPETLVLDFGLVGTTGFFEEAGLPSMPPKNSSQLMMRPGDMVAQINWDGEDTFVDWVMIEYVRTSDDTPHLELANYAEIGASGGGVFWNGYHIGNLWSRHLASNSKTGETIRHYNTAALNELALDEHTAIADSS